jgi:hypothetical protein
MASSDVERIHKEFTELISFLAEKGEPSLQTAADDSFRKILILSGASYFEHELSQVVVDFVAESTGSDPLIAAIVYQRAVSRQYHSWFDWDAKNANKFFRMFGDAFVSHMADAIRNSVLLDQSIKSFLELGRYRNQLAHQNFAAFAMEKTAEESFTLYRDALLFVESVRTELRVCSRKHKRMAGASAPVARIDDIPAGLA